MINLFKYITEASFSAVNFSHHEKYDYIALVLDDIISGKPIKIGKKRVESIYQPTPEEIEACKKFDPRKSTSKDFDKIFNGKIQWTKIFKLPYSKYKNKGKDFETIFAHDFHDKYQAEIEKCMGVKPGTLDDYDAGASEASENKRRPLILKNGQLAVGGFKDTVGKSVVDVKLKKSPVPSDNDINLSLKWETTVTFVNSGIAKIFSRKSFNDYIKNGGNYIPNCVNNLDGQLILDTFGIDNNKFADVFVNYDSNRSKIKNDGIDVTNKIDKNNILNLLYTAVGYDYILVHSIRGKIECTDLRQKSDMLKFVGNNIKKVTIYYGGRETTSKQVDIVVKLNNKSMRFSLRNTSGGVHPNKFLLYF